MSQSMIYGLSALFVISFLGNGPIPLPLTATVLWLGQFHLPVVVVLVSTLGTALGWIFLQNILKGWLNRNPHLADKIPASYRRFFLKNTGFWLFTLNALPFPLDFIRFLALMNHYPPKRLLLILTLARFIRNIILVMIGAALAKQQLLLWSVMVLFMTVPLLAGRWFDWRKRRDSEPAALHRKRIQLDSLTVKASGRNASPSSKL